MSKTVTDFLKPHELALLSEWQESRDKSRNDATYYAGQIKKMMDRAKARMKKEEGRV